MRKDHSGPHPLSDHFINKIETAFEGFEKDSLLIEQQDEFLRRRENLRHRVYELYAEFDSTAWWWARNIYDQARILHLISPARLDKLNEHIGQYNNNLVETAHAKISGDECRHAWIGREGNHAVIEQTTAQSAAAT